MSRTFTILCISHLSLLWEIFRHQRICFGWSLPDAPAGFVRRKLLLEIHHKKVDFNLHRNWLKKFPQVRQYLAGGYFQPQFEERVCLGHTYHLCRLTFSFIFISTSFASLVVLSLWRTQANNKMSCLKPGASVSTEGLYLHVHLQRLKLKYDTCSGLATGWQLAGTRGTTQHFLLFPSWRMLHQWRSLMKYVA